MVCNWLSARRSPEPTRFATTDGRTDNVNSLSADVVRTPEVPPIQIRGRKTIYKHLVPVFSLCVARPSTLFLHSGLNPPKLYPIKLVYHFHVRILATLFLTILILVAL